MTRRTSPSWLAALLLLSACGGADSTAPKPNFATPSNPSTPATATVVTTYLNAMLDRMQLSSINRLKIDWADFRNTVHLAAAGTQAISQLQPAIRTAITLLGDGHSSFTMASGSFIFVSNRTCVPGPVTVPITLPANIGYVRVTSFSGSGATANNFAQSIANTVANQDSPEIAGWIVDLRGNGGGNMWPMVAGLGEVLGEGVIGHFIDPVGSTVQWEYRNGVSMNGGFAIVTLPERRPLIRPNPRVAVLTDNITASSGEATAIAFRGRPNARTFGTASCGLSTANAGFTMSDGAVLNLTVSTMADRNRTLYGAQLAPDELISVPTTLFNRAVEWLLSPQ